MWKKKEEEKEEKEKSLLKELCDNDVKLCDFLGYYMYERPIEAISKKGLDILTEEAEISGDFGPAVDKAIFEATQTPGERERYIKIIQNLASKTIPVMKQKKENADKERLNDWGASLERKIEHQKFLIERTHDIITIASKFYAEKLVEQRENVRRESKRVERMEAEREEWKTEELEKAGREARRKERGEMGKEEKKEAKKQDKKDELAAQERKEARIEAEREEWRTQELEKAEREERRKERKGD
jgi:hypothetical protein